MEFKFRAVDHKPPSYQLPSSSISYFSDQSLRAGFSSVFPIPNTDRMPTPKDAWEEIQRELEKEQIRREIISGEITRRRMLEEEVRREMMVERELATRRNLNERFSFEERLAMRLNPRLHLMHPFDNRPTEDRIAFPISREFGMFPMPQLPQHIAPEIKPAPATNKDKLIILAKPDPDLYGRKRKTLTPPVVDGNEHSPFGLKKKPKEEWSCALCQVSATNEKGLNEHLQGRKHKAKEAALRIRKIGKSANTSFSSKKSEKSVKSTETIVTTTSGLDVKADGWSLQPGGINQTLGDKDIVKIRNEELLVQKNQYTEDSKKQNGTATGQVGKTNAIMNSKRKFRFWCEICQVGSRSQIVMESHKKGKKHMNRMKKSCQNDGNAPPTSTVLSEATALTTDTDAAANIERDLKTTILLSKETNTKMADSICKFRPIVSGD